MSSGRGSYKYVVVGFNGDPANTGFASRVSAVVAQMTKNGDRAMVVRFVPRFSRARSWKAAWPRDPRVTLLEVPALPISRYGLLRKISVALCSGLLRAVVAATRPAVLQCECHEAAALGSRLKFGGLRYADLHGAAPEEARYTRQSAGRGDLSMVRWLEEVEAEIVRRFDRLIVVTPRMIQHLEAKTGLPLQGKSAVLPIFADETFFKPLDKARWKRELGLEGKVVLLYSGGMQKYQCIEETVRWFAALRERIPNAHLLVFTPSPDVAQRTIRPLAGPLMADVTIRSVAKADLADHISAADFGFVLRERELLNTVSAPTKAVEYLARGVRPICTADAGNAADYVERFRSGLIVPLHPTPAEVDHAAAEIARLLALDVPVGDVHAQLSQGGYSETIRRLYDAEALA